MRVDHDADTGTVRLDTEACDALLALADDGADPSTHATPPSPVADLVTSGAVDAALAAMRTPRLQVRATVAGAQVLQHHDAWVGDDTAAFRLAVRDDEHQVTATPPPLLPAALARVVRLGPRKVGERAAFPVAPDLPDTWFSPDADQRAAALDAVEARFAWTVAAAWPDGETGITVVDGPHGAYVLTERDGDGGAATTDASPDGAATGLVLEPVTPTRLWRWLTTLLVEPPEPETPRAPQQ